MNPVVSIIAAVSRNGVIGKGGDLPWRIPGDLRRFRALTLGHAVVMGRRTFDSIGRALDGRRNIVATRNPHFHAAGVERADSPESALALAREGNEKGEIFIIGGGEMYEWALRGDFAERMILTEVDMEVAGDARFPHFSRADWRETRREKGETDGAEGIPHSFVCYERARGGK